MYKHDNPHFSEYDHALYWINKILDKQVDKQQFLENEWAIWNALFYALEPNAAHELYIDAIDALKEISSYIPSGINRSRWSDLVINTIGSESYWLDKILDGKVTETQFIMCKTDIYNALSDAIGQYEDENNIGERAIQALAKFSVFIPLVINRTRWSNLLISAIIKTCDTKMSAKPFIHKTFGDINRDQNKPKVAENAFLTAIKYSDDKEMIADLYISLFSLEQYCYASSYDLEEFVENAVLLIEDLRGDRKIAQLNAALVYVYVSKGMEKEALACADKSLSYWIKQEVYEDQAFIYHALSQLTRYDEKGTQRSRDYLKKSKNAFQRTEISHWRALILYEEGVLNGIEKDYARALEKYRLSHRTWESLNDPEKHHIQFASIFHSISLAYYYSKDFLQALYWAKEALNMWKKTQSNYHIALAYNLIGCIQIDLKNSSGASLSLKQATVELEELQYNPRKDEIAKCISINWDRLERIK